MQISGLADLSQREAGLPGPLEAFVSGRTGLVKSTLGARDFRLSAAHVVASFLLRVIRHRTADYSPNTKVRTTRNPKAAKNQTTKASDQKAQQTASGASRYQLRPPSHQQHHPYTQYHLAR